MSSLEMHSTTRISARLLPHGVGEVGGEQDDRLLGSLGEDALGDRLETGEPGHALIEDDHVRAGVAPEREGLGAVGGLADHLDGAGPVAR